MGLLADLICNGFSLRYLVIPQQIRLSLRVHTDPDLSRRIVRLPVWLFQTDLQLAHFPMQVKLQHVVRFLLRIIFAPVTLGLALILHNHQSSETIYLFYYINI